MKPCRAFLPMLILALLAGPAAARPGPEQAGYRSLERAVSQARRETGGRVLSARTLEENGRRTHVIRILTEDGRVRRLRMDARDPRPRPPRRR